MFVGVFTVGVVRGAHLNPAVSIGLATAGLAGFTLAAAVAGLYLVAERRLRLRQWKPRPGAMSLAGLEKLHYQIVLLVTPVFTLAIVTGVLWTLRAGGATAWGRAGSRS